MNWKKFENGIVSDLTKEEYQELLKTINNPSAIHGYKDIYIVNATNVTYTANEIELIIQQLEKDDN